NAEIGRVVSFDDQPLQVEVISESPKLTPMNSHDGGQSSIPPSFPSGMNGPGSPGLQSRPRHERVISRGEFSQWRMDPNNDDDNPKSSSTTATTNMSKSGRIIAPLTATSTRIASVMDEADAYQSRLEDSQWGRPPPIPQQIHVGAITH